MIYDSIIIGSGIAGASAAMNLKIRNKTFLIFGSPSFNAKAIKAEQILNYPGMPDINGRQLSDAVFNHLKQMDIAVTDKKINGVFRYNDTWHVTSGMEMFEARTVILATGVEFSNPLEGEQALVGMGVSYCATCDGMLYKDKDVAVIATSADAEKEMLYLSEIASHVSYMPTYPLKNNFDDKDNLTIYKDRPQAILGDNTVTGVRLKSGEDVSADGVFILKDAISPSTLVYGLETDGRHIIVDRQMRTSLEGCFACGDCTGRPYQYVKAAGEGNIAAHSAIEYLAKSDK